MEKKRLPIGTISILVLSAMLLAFSSALASEDPIIFAGDKSFPPVEYLEQDVPKGLNIDLLEELANAMGRRIEIRLMQWEDAQQKVLSGEIDAITTMAINEKRKELYDFSDITLKYQYSIFARTEQVGIQTTGDLDLRVLNSSPPTGHDHRFGHASIPQHERYGSGRNGDQGLKTSTTGGGRIYGSMI